MILCPACGAGHADADFNCPHCAYRPTVQDGVPLLAPALAAEVEGFDDRAIASLAASEAGHFWFEARNRLIVDRFRAVFAGARDYLEVGAGTGFVLSAIAKAFPAMALTASEVLASGLAHAVPRVPRARMLQLDARALPFEAAFDVIGAFDVLEHIEEDEAVLARFHRALRPGGGVILTVPQHRWLWSAEDDVGGHVRRYRRGELEAKLRAGGFRIIDSTSFTSLLLPAMWLSRRLAGADAAGDNQAELAPPRLLGRALGAVMALERRAIALGLRFPVGGSRLVLARRQEAR
ncbi:class I SAM-dependent methyltransferase [Luteimonas sp. A534]